MSTWQSAVLHCSCAQIDFVGCYWSGRGTATDRLSCNSVSGEVQDIGSQLVRLLPCSFTNLLQVACAQHYKQRAIPQATWPYTIKHRQHMYVAFEKHSYVSYVMFLFPFHYARKFGLQ